VCAGRWFSLPSRADDRSTHAMAKATEYYRRACRYLRSRHQMMLVIIVGVPLAIKPAELER
jgi:hypothetical protein